MLSRMFPEVGFLGLVGARGWVVRGRGLALALGVGLCHGTSLIAAKEIPPAPFHDRQSVETIP
jgi:hypothetical protein